MKKTVEKPRDHRLRKGDVQRLSGMWLTLNEMQQRFPPTAACDVNQQMELEDLLLARDAIGMMLSRFDRLAFEGLLQLQRLLKGTPQLDRAPDLNSLSTGGAAAEV